MQIYGTREVATIGPRKHITIAYPAPQETLLGSPDPLPTSEPGTPQVIFTVGSGDMPTLTGMPATNARYSPLLYVGGHNPTGVLHLINAAIYLNGVNWTTQTLDPDPTFQAWMLTIYPFGVGDPSIAVGDELAIALWSDDVLVDYQYSAFALFPTQLQAVAPYTVMLNVGFTDIVQFPILTTPDVIVSAGNYATVTSIGFPRGSNINGAPVIIIDPDLPIYEAERGDAQTGADVISDSDTLFSYYVNYMPSDISLYPTSIRVQ